MTTGQSSRDRWQQCCAGFAVNGKIEERTPSVWPLSGCTMEHITLSSVAQQPLTNATPKPTLTLLILTVYRWFYVMHHLAVSVVLMALVDRHTHLTVLTFEPFCSCVLI